MNLSLSELITKLQDIQRTQSPHVPTDISDVYVENFGLAGWRTVRLVSGEENVRRAQLDNRHLQHTR